MNEKLTITLTDARPVTITKDLWPIIAEGKEWDNTYESQANRHWRVSVRQHADGRSIVYGIHTTQWEGARGARAGEKVEAGGDLIAAIKRVAASIGADAGVAQRCISELAAEELD